MEDQEVTLVMQLVASQRKFEKQMRAMSAAARNNFKKMTKYGRKFERSMGRVANRVKTIFAGAFAGLATGNLISGLFDVNKRFQDFVTSLKTATGTIAKARGAFADIRKFAETTPYGVAEITDGFIKLVNRGLRPTMKVMRSFGNTASAMGKSLDQMIEAVADAATGEFERLKEFGIIARSQGNKVVMTFQGVSKKIGKNAKEITNYLKSIGETKFAGAMADKMKNLSGLASNLRDKIDSLYLKIGDAGATGAFAFAITAAGGAVDFFAQNMNVLQGIFVGVGVVIVGALIPAIKAMTLALLKNPFGLAITAIAATVGLLVSMSDVMVGTGKNMATLGSYFGVAFDKIGSFAAKLWDGVFGDLVAGGWVPSLLDSLKRLSSGFGGFIVGAIAGVTTLWSAAVQAGGFIVDGFVAMKDRVAAIFNGLFSALGTKFSNFADAVKNILTDPFSGWHMKESFGISERIDQELSKVKSKTPNIQKTMEGIGKAFKLEKSYFKNLLDFSDIGDEWTKAAQELDQVNKPKADEVIDKNYLPDFPAGGAGGGSGSGGGGGGRGGGSSANDNAHLETIAKFGSVSDKARVAADEFNKSLLALGKQVNTGKIDQETYNNAVDNLKGVYDKAKAAAADYGGVVGTIMDGVKDTLKGVFSEIFKNGKITMKSLGDMVNNMMNRIFDKVMGLAIDGIFKLIGFKDGGFVQGFAGGGAVNGAGTGTSDSIPARLSKGEFVVNAGATSKYRGLLEQINSGNKIAFANQNAVMQNINVANEPTVNVSVIVNNNSAAGVNVRQNGSDIEIDIFEQVENGLVKRIHDGDSNLPAAVAGGF